MSRRAAPELSPTTNPLRQRTLPPPLRVVLGLLLLIIVGTLALMLPGVGSQRQLTLREALFTATSALSVTGLAVIAPGRDLTIIGQLVLLLLIQVGGVGFMVLAVVVFRLLGRKVTLMDRLALRDSFGLLDAGAILRVARRVLITVLAIEALGAALLWLNWRDELGAGRALLYALFHAVSAFCNAGFDLFNGLPEFPQGLPNDGISLTIVGSLIVLGGLGIPVIADLLTWPSDRQFSLHTRITLTVVVLLTLLGTLGLFLAESQGDGLIAQQPLERQLGLALFHTISTRTAGFVAVTGFESLAPASQLLMIVLMFIGCAPASMGGGITTGTLAVLVLALLTYARGEQTPHIAGRSIPTGMVRKAGAILTVSLLVVLTATWLILISHPQATLDQALFEVVSAFATCGLTLAFTSELNLFGQLVIILVMFWGRLGALTLVVAFARISVPRVTYPEEQILIG